MAEFNEANAIETAEPVPTEDNFDMISGEPCEGSEDKGISAEGIVAIATLAGMAGTAIVEVGKKIYHCDKVQSVVSEVKRKREIRKTEKASVKEAHKTAKEQRKNKPVENAEAATAESAETNPANKPNKHK